MTKTCRTFFLLFTHVHASRTGAQLVQNRGKQPAAPRKSLTYVTKLIKTNTFILKKTPFTSIIKSRYKLHIHGTHMETMTRYINKCIHRIKLE